MNIYSIFGRSHSYRRLLLHLRQEFDNFFWIFWLVLRNSIWIHLGFFPPLFLKFSHLPHYLSGRNWLLLRTQLSSLEHVTSSCLIVRYLRRIQQSFHTATRPNAVYLYPLHTINSCRSVSSTLSHLLSPQRSLAVPSPASIWMPDNFSQQKSTSSTFYSGSVAVDWIQRLIKYSVKRLEPSCFGEDICKKNVCMFQSILQTQM